MLNKILLRLYLYINGMRFYETMAVPKTPEFKKAVFEVVCDRRVEFYFYKEVTEDLLFLRGKIKKQSSVGYVIQARFDENLPAKLYRYNNLKFFFTSSNIIINDDDMICSVLLEIYLDFLRQEMESV